MTIRWSTADPSDARSARTIYREAGSIAPDDISADGAQVLFLRGISNRESKLLRARPRVRPGDPDRAEGRKVLYSLRVRARRPQRVSPSPTGQRFQRLVEIDIASGKDTVLTPELKWDVEAFTISDDDRLLAYAVNEDGFSNVMVRDLVTRRALPQPELPRGVLQSMEFSPDNTRLAIGLSTATSAGDVWSWDVTGGALARWTTSELGGLDPAKLAEPELVRFKSFDGLSSPRSSIVRGRRGRRPHAGDHQHPWRPGRADAADVQFGAQYLADGSALRVILPNVRGTTGYGKTLRRPRQCGEARGLGEGHRRAARLDRDAARPRRRIAWWSTASPTAAT